MRIIRNLLFVTSFTLVSTFVMAGDITGFVKPENKQIKQLLSSIQFGEFVNSETKINISFFVNAKNEVIVVSTNNTDLDQVVKSTLNYQKITVSELEYNKIYTIPVVIR